MSPGSLSGEERLTFTAGESLAAITALNPQIRELRWGLYGFLRISTPTLFGADACRVSQSSAGLV